MPSMQDSLRAYAVVVGALATAAAAAWAASRLGATAPVPPAAAAMVIATVFWWRAAEGLTAFGAFALLAATIEHWLALDLLLFDEISIVLITALAVMRHRVPNRRLHIGWAELGLASVIVAGATSSVVEDVGAVTLFAGLALLLKAIALFYVVS
ncbi:MAG: hypothetical protein ABIW50_05840, partial [Candidatus Limnocylindria bacterium]